MAFCIFFIAMFNVCLRQLLTIFLRLPKSLVLARVMKVAIFLSLNFLWTKRMTNLVKLRRVLPLLKIFSSRNHKVGMRHQIVRSQKLPLKKEV